MLNGHSCRIHLAFEKEKSHNLDFAHVDLNQRSKNGKTAHKQVFNPGLIRFIPYRDTEQK